MLAQYNNNIYHTITKTRVTEDTSTNNSFTGIFLRKVDQASGFLGWKGIINFRYKITSISIDSTGEGYGGKLLALKEKETVLL